MRADLGIPQRDAPMETDREGAELPLDGRVLMESDGPETPLSLTSSTVLVPRLTVLRPACRWELIEAGGQEQKYCPSSEDSSLH